MTERWMDQIALEKGRGSPEARTAASRLEELKERLCQMDEKYSAFLRSRG